MEWILGGIAQTRIINRAAVLTECALALIFFALASTAFAQSPPTPSEIAGYKGLHQAAHSGDVKRISALISAGEDVEKRDGSGRTPAHVAAFASQDKALRALADGGADMNALDNQKYDILTIASVANDPALVSLALELGNRADLITSPYGGTALIAAAHLGHHEVIRRLIAGGAPLDHVNNLGWTALMEAVVLGDGGGNHIATVKILLDAGANPEIPDKNGVTPLGHATSRNYETIARLIQGARSTD